MLQTPTAIRRLWLAAPFPHHWEPDPKVILTGVPAILFYVFTKTLPTPLAILGGFIAFVLVLYLTRGSKAFQALSLVSLIAVTTGTAFGMIAGSEKAFLAAGPASDFLIAPIFIVSACIGRPLVGAVARETVPGLAGHISHDAKIFVWLTVTWGVFNVGTGLLRSYLLANSSVGEYMVWSRVIGWPLGWTAIGLIGLVILFEARRSHPDRLVLVG